MSHCPGRWIHFFNTSPFLASPLKAQAHFLSRSANTAQTSERIMSVLQLPNFSLSLSHLCTASPTQLCISLSSLNRKGVFSKQPAVYFVLKLLIHTESKKKNYTNPWRVSASKGDIRRRLFLTETLKRSLNFPWHV